MLAQVTQAAHNSLNQKNAISPSYISDGVADVVTSTSLWPGLQNGFAWAVTDIVDINVTTGYLLGLIEDGKHCAFNLPRTSIDNATASWFMVTVATPAVDTYQVARLVTTSVERLYASWPW